MAIQIKQVSDYGTSNPIVARLSIQTRDLLPLYQISENQREELLDIMFSDIQPRLLACFRIKEELCQEIRSFQRRIDEDGLEIQAQGRAYTLPSILDLRHRAETFLYNAKSALRDLTGIFLVLFAEDFKKEARFDRLLEWAKQKFGTGDPFTKMLQNDQATWIKKIVDMRNAVEHPGGHSGVLHIENFTGVEDNHTVLVTEPVWYLNSGPKLPVAQEMDVMVTNLLTFCEETLVLCLEQFKGGFPLRIAEIPETERDSKCPVRFRLAIDPAKMDPVNKMSHNAKSVPTGPV